MQDSFRESHESESGKRSSSSKAELLQHNSSNTIVRRKSSFLKTTNDTVTLSFEVNGKVLKPTASKDIERRPSMKAAASSMLEHQGFLLAETEQTTDDNDDIGEARAPVYRRVGSFSEMEDPTGSGIPALLDVKTSENNYEMRRGTKISNKGSNTRSSVGQESVKSRRLSISSTGSIDSIGRRLSLHGKSQATVEQIVSKQRDKAVQRNKGDSTSTFKRDIFFAPAMQQKQERNEGNGSLFGNTPQLRKTKDNSFAEEQAEKNRLSALQKRINRVHSTADPINFYDVVEAEAEPQATTTDFSDRLAGKITESVIFQRFILICIILNTVLSVLYTDPYFEQNYGRLIDQADSAFLTIFFLEMALKMKYQKQGFWYDNWNLFDFSLIFVSLLGTVVRDIGTRKTIGGRGLRFLRVMRAFRTLRILGALRSLQIVVNTFLKSLVELTNIIAMILLLMFMFSILGLQLFEPIVPQYFGTLTLSFQSLFVLITQDGWVKIWADIEDASSKTETSVLMIFINHLYFILFIVIGAWVFINIISGVTVTNWQLYVQEMKQMEKARFHDIENKSLRSSIFFQEARPISISNVAPESWVNQVPLSSASSLGRISVQKLENYLLVLSALEKNIKEYQGLKRNLFKHLDVVQRTNMLMDLHETDDVDGEEEDDDEFLDGDVLSVMQTKADVKSSHVSSSTSLLAERHS